MNWYNSLLIVLWLTSLLLSRRYKKVRSSDVIQLQLSDLGDVNVRREIDGEELKRNARTEARQGEYSHISKY